MKFSINKNSKIIKKICKDDGQFPNSNLPVLIYKAAVILPDKHAATIIEDVFKKNNWTNAWRNGIYNYHHYHSITHEVLGVYEGNTIVQLGGPKGITTLIEKGDVIIIPAGVAHKNMGPETNFKCVGAYPCGSTYDMNYGKPDERPKADNNIKKVALPDADPVYGKFGYLVNSWKI